MELASSKLSFSEDMSTATFTSRFHVSEAPPVVVFRIELPPLLRHSRNRPWHKQSEEPHEIRQLPPIDLHVAHFA
jgi:hypothetical protein